MKPEPITVRVVRRFDASPERVFDAWLDPQLLGRWMFGPSVRREDITRVSFDPRLGGSFSFAVRREGEEIDHLGLICEIDRPRRLAFSWGVAGSSADRQLSVDIAPLDIGCELTLTHSMLPTWADRAPGIQEQWNRMLTALDAALR